MIDANGQAVGFDILTVGINGRKVGFDIPTIGSDGKTVGSNILTVGSDDETVDIDDETVGFNGGTVRFDISDVDSEGETVERDCRGGGSLFDVRISCKTAFIAPPIKYLGAFPVSMEVGGTLKAMKEALRGLRDGATLICRCQN